MEVWQVALLQKRRKEFNVEWGLRSDLQRSGVMQEYIAVNYPDDQTSGAALIDYPWTNKSFTYNDQKMTMPIPTNELINNSACTQDEGC